MNSTSGFVLNKLQIEIRALQPISKVLRVFKTVLSTLTPKPTYMEIKHFVGVDVSKSTLDIAVVVDARKQLHYQIKNTAKDIKAFLPKLLHEIKATIADTVFCMEYTGIYNNL